MKEKKREGRGRRPRTQQPRGIDGIVSRGSIPGRAAAHIGREAEAPLDGEGCDDVDRQPRARVVDQNLLPI